VRPGEEVEVSGLQLSGPLLVLVPAQEGGLPAVFPIGSGSGHSPVRVRHSRIAKLFVSAISLRPRQDSNLCARLRRPDKRRAFGLAVAR
jgi:hypothetical protein